MGLWDKVGTAYENQSLWYRNFYIRIINNGTGQANYLSFYVVMGDGVFMRDNISTHYAASSCTAENVNGSFAIVALSNFGPKQSLKLFNYL